MKSRLAIITFLTTIAVTSWANCTLKDGGCKLNPEFVGYNNKLLKGPKAAPPKDIAPGLEFMALDEALKHIKNDNYVFIDTRPKHLYNQCRIRRAKHYDWGFPGRETNTLTKKVVEELIKKGKTIVYYCNARKCYRSLNAAIQSYQWGFPAAKIKWFGDGVPGVIRGAEKYRKYVKGKGCAQFLK